MATSGTIQEAIRTGYRLQITWTVDSQSVANNTSTVTAKVQLVSTGSSYTINSSASKSGSLTINGTKYTFNFTAALSGSQTKTLFTKTVTVAHAADGSKTCSFSATCGINVTLSGTYYGDVTASGSGIFNTIARASTISSVTSSVSVTGSNAVTVNITRAASSFTHTVVFSFGSYSKTTAGVGTSTSYTIPQSWLNAIPNATSGTAKVTVTTYSGSTKIGSAVSESFTLTVPSSVVPSISAVSLSEAVSGLAAQFGGYVQNKSKIAVKITAAGVLNDSIVSASGFMSIDSSYDIRLSVKDYFTTVRSVFEIPTAFTLLDFNASGKGIAFGKVSELTEGIEFALPTLFGHAETPSSVKYLNTGDDLNDILEPGFYAIPTTAVSGTLLNKPWSGTATGGLVVLREGDGMGKCQIAHKLSKDDGAIYERSYYQSAWGDWETVHNGKGKVLWSGGYYMTAAHVITLSEKVSQQPSGIVLVFSRYSGGTAQNYHFNHFFISKEWVKLHGGTGCSFIMTTDGLFGMMASKYLYIHDDKIGGNDVNNQSGTGASGITYNNAGFVLRYVIGV